MKIEEANFQSNESTDLEEGNSQATLQSTEESTSERENEQDPSEKMEETNFQSNENSKQTQEKSESNNLQSKIGDYFSRISTFSPSRISDSIVIDNKNIILGLGCMNLVQAFLLCPDIDVITAIGNAGQTVPDIGGITGIGDLGQSGSLSDTMVDSPPPFMPKVQAIDTAAYSFRTNVPPEISGWRSI